MNGSMSTANRSMKQVQPDKGYKFGFYKDNEKFNIDFSILLLFSQGFFAGYRWGQGTEYGI
jgi:hypothetical protein